MLLLCGTACVPGAGGPGCGAGPLGVPVGGGPPASRPRREPSARRVVSKPGQALPPPTGTAARPSAPSGALHSGGAWTLMLLGACHGVKPDRWNPADSALVWGRAERELHAELGELPVSWLSLLFGVHYMGRCAA